MLRTLLLLLPALCWYGAQAQNNTTKDTLWKTTYRGSVQKVNNLVHTRLDLRPDIENEQLHGKAWITLKPHFYATDTVWLDAKAMHIEAVQLVRSKGLQKLSYTYPDSMRLRIVLDKKYTAGEPYTIYIAYTARMNRVEHASATGAFTGKGLQYSLPDKETGNKAIQMWTQGQTEFSSCWFPTIDKPNQRTTGEIKITVPASMVTLSNGTLAGQKNNGRLRTDAWKMEQPNPPYLFFIAAGEYAVVKEKHRNINLEYYVEKEYKDVAPLLFRNTGAIIDFFSEKLGIAYGWSKYAQISCRGFIGAAMENTTAVAFSDKIQRNKRELRDEDEWESVVAHEIMHHWFGNLVTPESWSNLPLSEGLATYGEYLWFERKYGRQKADEHFYISVSEYLGDPRNGNKQLIRNIYRDKEDMFDAVSYHKAAWVFHSLRNEVGDEAFFKALNIYLSGNRLKSVEATGLRLAFEEVTGKDLSTFWNQWFYGTGHPQLDIAYNYSEQDKTVSVVVKQTQKSATVYHAPVDLDVYAGGKKKTYNLWLNNRTDTFLFSTDRRPDLVNFDSKKILLCEKKENKTVAEYIYQYNHSDLYAGKREALEKVLGQTTDMDAIQFALGLLADKQTPDGFKRLILRAVDETGTTDEAVMGIVEQAAMQEKNSINRALALDILGKLKNKAYAGLFAQNAMDSSYTVAGAALDALLKVDEQKAISLLPALKNDNRGRLKKAVYKTVVLTKNDADFDAMYAGFTGLSLVDQYKENFVTLFHFITYLGQVQNPDNFKKGLNSVIEFRTTITPYSAELKDMITKALQEVKEKKQKMLQSSPAANTGLQALVKDMDVLLR